MPSVYAGPQIERIARGFEGELYRIVNNVPKFLGNVNEFEISFSIAGMDFQPPGSMMVSEIVTGMTGTLTLVETVVHDAELLYYTMKQMSSGKVPSFAFEGKLVNNADSSARSGFYRIEDCTPSGTLPVLSVKPGDKISRSWTFRINKFMDWTKFKDAYYGKDSSKIGARNYDDDAFANYSTTFGA